MARRSEVIFELKTAIREYEEAVDTVNSMDKAWHSGDPYAMAANDPGLQFEAESKRDEAWTALISAAQDLVNHKD